MHAAELRERRDARDALLKSEARLADVRRAVDESAAEVPADRIAECEAVLAQVSESIAAVSSRIDESDQKRHHLAVEYAQLEARQTNLRDNIRLRQVVRDIGHAEAELASLDLDEAHRHYNNFSSQYDEARKRESDMNGEATHLRGEMYGVKAEIQSREDELRDEYKDVHDRYMRKVVRIKVASMSNMDLDKYCGALQQAILQYHSIKMEEVNETIDYLWRKTYQGTDIDTILIRSDSEGKLSANGTRSYQYRVCMVKDATEMDMRGRCSAGQKVLACILIRLALADSFGSNCGFLALDEPTTNLDQENVEALASSLVEYVQMCGRR